MDQKKASEVLKGRGLTIIVLDWIIVIFRLVAWIIVMFSLVAFWCVHLSGMV